MKAETAPPCLLTFLTTASCLASMIRRKRTAGIVSGAFTGLFGYSAYRVEHDENTMIGHGLSFIGGSMLSLMFLRRLWVNKSRLQKNRIGKKYFIGGGMYWSLTAVEFFHMAYPLFFWSPAKPEFVRREIIADRKAQLIESQQRIQEELQKLEEYEKDIKEWNNRKPVEVPQHIAEESQVERRIK